MKTLYQRITTGLTAAALIVAQVIMPAQVAFATDKGPAGSGGTEQQVFCNLEGASGKWKAQIGGPSTEHESPLKDAQGNNIFVHDQKDVTDEMDTLCKEQYGAVTAVAPEVTVVCGANNDMVALATTDHVAYSQSGWVAGSNIVTAVADKGYTISGPVSFTLTDVATAGCAQTDKPATPQAPTVTKITKCGTYGSIVFAETEGVDYALTTGDRKQGAYTVTATAKPGYALTAEVQTIFSGDLGTFTECEEVLTCPANTEWSDKNSNQRVDEGECFKKVFVCKYVGTPGINERLQTGDNPISVSVNSIKDFQGVRSYFNDAQGRSYVLAFDEGQPEPSADLCPAGTPGPTKCTVKDQTLIQPWTFDGATYPEAGVDPIDSEAAPGAYKFVYQTGLELKTPDVESYVYGLIDAGKTPMADVDAMTYLTYRDASSTGYAGTLPAYILAVDIDGNLLTTTDVKYFFYEPYNNGTVLVGTWQTWDAISGGAAKWWMSGTGQALRTWDSFVAQYDSAIVLAYGFNQGSYNQGTNSMIQDIEFDCATTHFSAPGGGGGGVTPPVEPPVTPVTPVTPKAAVTPALPAELPVTGGLSSLSAVIIALATAVAAYGAVYFAQSSRRYEQ